MELIIYIFYGLLTILPIILYALLSHNEQEGKSSWGELLGTIIGFLTIIALFYYILENPSNEPSQIGILKEAKQIDPSHSGFINDWDFIGLSNGVSWLIRRIYIGLTAFLPAIAYMLYITAFDSKKPEPKRLLLLTAFIGCIAAFTVTATGLPIYHGGFYSDINYGIVDSLKIGFLKIAIPSEAIKWLFLLIFLSINKYYDEYLDGIVYSVCLALGFACVLGIGYMFDFVKFSFLRFAFKGLVTALILIPTHMMAGAVMGYFFALGKKGNRILYYAIALGAAILIDGGICTMLALMGDYRWYYIFIGIVLLLLSMGFYRQVRHLMILDNIRFLN